MTEILYWNHFVYMSPLENRKFSPTFSNLCGCPMQHQP
jgi:hypothetical protein